MSLFGQTRIFYNVANDMLLPGLFSKVHPKFGTPYLSQSLIGVLVAFVAAVAPIDFLSEVVSIGTLLAFILVCGAVISLRRNDATVFRPFRVPACLWSRCSASPFA